MPNKIKCIKTSIKGKYICQDSDFKKAFIIKKNPYKQSYNITFVERNF